MSGIIISAHGGRWSDQTKTCVVPAGSRVMFYVKDNQVLPNTAGWELLDELTAGTIDQSEICETVKSGSSTYDYSCWYASDFAEGCGIYEVGGGDTPIQSLKSYTEDSPLLLSTIMANYPNYDIYWLACREVTPSSSRSLQTSDDAYLKQAKPAPTAETSYNEVPGASVLGYGFDALGSFDISSLTQQIFTHQNMQASEFTYQPTGITYNVPDNTSIIVDTTTTGTAQVFSTRQQFQNYFSAKADISGSYGAFNAQFSAAYSQTLNSDVSYYYGLYETDITGWNLNLENQSSSWVSSSFTNDPDVQALPDTYSTANQQLFFAVFRKFGTHFVSQVSVGGSLDYYLAIEESYSSNETTVETNVQLEYDAVFVSASAESQVEWNQLGQNWANSRTVKIDAVGGDNTIVNALLPEYDSSFNTTYTTWINSVMANPAVMSFQLRPLNFLFSGTQATAVSQALQAYLNGAIVATANADYTPSSGPGGGNFTTSSSVMVNGTLLSSIPPETTPAPYVNKWGWIYPIAGYQVALLDGTTLETILSYTYYQDDTNYLTSEQEVYSDIMTDINDVTQTGYICVVAGFAIDLMNYPSTAFSQWLASCGAAMSGWKQYLGFTGSPGIASYVMVGKQGLLPGNAYESFAAATDWVDYPWASTVDASVTALLYADSTLQSTGTQTSYGSATQWATAPAPTQETAPVPAHKPVHKAPHKPNLATASKG